MLPRFRTDAVLALLATIAENVEERTNWLVLRDAYRDAGATEVEARTLVYMAVLPHWDARRMVIAANAVAAPGAVGVMLRAAIRFWTDSLNRRVPIMVVNDRIPPTLRSTTGVQVTRQCRPDYPRGRRFPPRPLTLPPVEANTIFVGCAWVCRRLATAEERYTPTHELAWGEDHGASVRTIRRKGVARG